MKSLKIAILSKIKSPTVTAELMPDLEKRGHKVEIIDLSVVPTINFDQHPLVKSLLDFDVVYYRTGLTPHGAAYLESILKDTQVKTVNLHYSKHLYAHDKTYETDVAHKGGVLVPKTISDGNQTYAFATEILGSPFVIKPNMGTLGTGVELIHNEGELSNYLNNSDREKIHLQECIPHDSEYRVHTLGGKVVAMYKRVPAIGEFKSNISIGGSNATC